MPDTEYENIKAGIAKLFAHELNVDVPSATTDLLDTGILDSQKFVELLLCLEQEFKAQIPVEDFEIENFRCIEKIASLVVQHKAPAKVTTS
jgi:acyl carrier protein